MKKILCLLLFLSIMLSFASCSWFRRPEPTTESTKPSTAPSTRPTVTDPTPSESIGQTDPSEPAVQIPDLPMISVSLPLIHETTTASDTTEIFRYTFQDVALNIGDSNVAKAITLDLLQRMDSNSKNVADLEARALKEYVSGGDWTTYYYEVIYTPTRIDETVLSLSGIHSSYDGKAHPTNSSSSATYNLVTGKFLAVSDILSDTADAADALCAALIVELDKIAKDNSLFTGYQDIIRSSFSMDLNRYYAWYFTNDGICFYFSPYEIAPNSAGTVKVTVPYGSLSGVLKDDYFPVEQPSVEGTLSATWFDEADLEKFTQFSELIDKPDARRSVLWVDTVIYDVRLEQGYWNSSTNQFTADSTVFTANCIAEGDALTLRCELSDTTPTLLLHYISGGKAHSCFITKNHTTGAIDLTSTN